MVIREMRVRDGKVTAYGHYRWLRRICGYRPRTAIYSVIALYAGDVTEYTRRANRVMRWLNKLDRAGG